MGLSDMAQYFRLFSVCARYGLSRSTLYAWIKQGRFPAPVKLGPRASAWALADLERWECERRISGVLQ